MNFQIIWSKPAQIDVTNAINRQPIYFQKSRIKFFSKLKKFLTILESMPYLGKRVSDYDFEVRQLIYEKYRIFYTIFLNRIIILRVIHSKSNFNYNILF